MLAKEIKNMFTELKASGCALLISTHMLDSVEDFWGRRAYYGERHFCRYEV